MDITDLVGQVATIRTVTGEEIIARVKDVERNGSLIAVTDPLVVMIDETGSAMTLPYSITGRNELVYFQVRNIFSITRCTPEAQSDYEVQTADAG